jgi:hypothetical protein
MKQLVKTEFYKLCKADHTLMLALLLLYPVMWSVLVYRDEVILLENGHSMLSWILIQLFSIEKPFVLTLVLGIIANTIVGEEKRKGYFPMIQSRGIRTEQIYPAKAVAIMGYFFLIFLVTMAVIAVFYTLFVRNHTTIASGRLVNTGELIPGIKILLIWVLDKCVLFPSIFTWLSKKWNMMKTVILIFLFSLLDRGIAMLPKISVFSIWKNYKNAEHFVSLCREGRLEIHMGILIQIMLCSGIVLLLMKRGQVKKQWVE